ncbi:MAG: flavodoxin domain-containing protein [Pseudomonadota bacterium]
MTETHRYLLAFLATTLYVLWVAVLYYKHKKVSDRTLAHSLTSDNTLVVYASQTGTAEKIARIKAAQLQLPEPAPVISMASLSLQSLQRVSKVIFVVSTYGEGEPPDMGRKFNRAIAQAATTGSTTLSHLHFEVVGVGDRQYARFCQFADTLFDSIKQLGGNAAQPVQKLDAGSGEHLALLNTSGDVHYQQPSITLTLTKRNQLNGDSPQSQKLCALSFDYNSHLSNAHWQAGDVLDVLIEQNNEDAELNLPAPNASQHQSSHQIPKIIRTYTIASVPEEKNIKLVVRQLVKDEGELGIGSGFLTDTLQNEQPIKGYIRQHANACITDTQSPLLLIGAGSGVAGIRAQLAKRALLKDAGPVWILFGERHPTFDDVLDKTLSPFHLSSCLIRKHTIFSQATHGSGYVQQLLLQQSSDIRSFLGQTGQVYVCGRYEGMGKGVDDALRSILGDSGHKTLAEHKRYHRDLY